MSPSWALRRLLSRLARERADAAAHALLLMATCSTLHGGLPLACSFQPKGYGDVVYYDADDAAAAAAADDEDQNDDGDDDDDDNDDD